MSFNGTSVLLSPRSQRQKDRAEALTEWRDFIFDLWRDLRMDMPQYHSIRLKFAKLQGQHSLSSIWDGTAQFHKPLLTRE